MTFRHTLAITAVLAAAGSIGLPASAQFASGREIVDRIVSSSDSMVSIDIPAELIRQLDPAQQTHRPARNPNALKPGVNRIEGYRVQVFSDGTNPRTLEARARSRGNAIVAKFPKYRGQVYSHSSAPNWYTRIGNFRTQGEAASALAELKRAFPSLRAEMRIVKCQIIVIGPPASSSR